MDYFCFVDFIYNIICEAFETRITVFPNSLQKCRTRINHSYSFKGTLFLFGPWRSLLSLFFSSVKGRGFEAYRGKRINEHFVFDLFLDVNVCKTSVYGQEQQMQTV